MTSIETPETPRQGLPQNEARFSIRRLTNKFGQAVLLTLISQVSSALGLLILQLMGPSEADLYSVGLQIGYIGLTSGILGVTYNVAVGRPGFRSWRAHEFGASALSVLVCVITLGSLIVGRPDEASYITLVVFGGFGLGGCALAVAGSQAVRLALLGNANWLAGIAIVPNLSILLSLLVAIFLEPGIALLLPVVVWMISCGALAIYLTTRRKSRDSDELEATLGRSSSERTHTLFLALSVLASAVVPTLAIAAVTQLPAGSAALIFIVGRIGTSLIGLGVNSVLMVRYNWNATQTTSARMYRVLILTGLAGVLIASALELANLSMASSYFVLSVSWIAMLVSGAIIGREVNAKRLTKVVAAKVIVDVVYALSAVGLLWIHPSVTGYFAVFMVSQAVTVLICSYGLRLRTVPWLSAAMIVCSFGLIAYGW